MSNIVSILQKRSSLSLNAYLFLADGQEETASITYASLDQKAREIAAYLQANTVVGERVLLLFPSGIDFIVAFFGCLYAGVIAVPLFCPTIEHCYKMRDFLKIISKDLEISGVLTEASLFSAAQESSPLFRQPTFITDVSLLDPGLSGDYKSLKIKGDMIAYLQFTSGSVSTPKAAIIRHRNLIHNIKQSSTIWRYTRKSVTFTFASHGHVFGLICGLLVPLYRGSLAIFMPPQTFLYQPLLWLKAITKYGVTHSGCPNFGYDLCVQRSGKENHYLNLTSWKIAINGGENIRAGTLYQFAQKFKHAGFSIKQFCSAYGMSELAGTIAASRFGKKPVIFNLSIPKLAQHKAVTVNKNKSHTQQVASGRVLPGLRVIIVNPTTLKPLSAGKIGEICVAGKALMDGYWQGAEGLNDNLFVRLPHSKIKYYRTGDLGFLKKNELCVTGRLKEVIVRYGKNFYPLDLEMTVRDAIRNFPAGQQIVFAVELGGRDEIFILQEIQATTKAAEIDKMIISIRQAITQQHQLEIHGVIFVKETVLPKTSSGKLQRTLAKKLYLEDEFAIVYAHFKNQPELSKNRREGISGIKNNFKIPQKLMSDFKTILASAFRLDPHHIDLHADVSSFGLDSITIVQFIALFNEKYGLTLSPAVMYEYVNFDEFINDILKQYPLSFQGYYSDKELPSKVSENPIVYSSMNHNISPNSNDIAVIGVQGCFPGAPTLAHFWDNLVNGKDVITEIPKDRWEMDETSVGWGGFIDNIQAFDANFFNISPREAEIIDPQQRIFLQTVWQTIEDAGYSISALSQQKVGLFVGVFSHDYAQLLHQRNITDAYLTTGTTHSILANRVSYLLNLKGPSEAIDTACSSSLVAIHHAIQSILNGESDIAIAGGVNALLSNTAYKAATNAGMLSMEGKCKTFDQDANGYVRSEGVGAILLKPLQQAIGDNDHIYGIIKSTSVNHGGHVSSITVPNPNAQAQVIINACEKADIHIDTLSYIETHGTGTTLGDPIEISGLKKAFSFLAEKKGLSLAENTCGLGSVKTNIGHLESAAGIASVIKVLLCMKNKYLPANQHFKTLNPYIDLADSPFYVVNKGIQWQNPATENNNQSPLRAGISSFGFGGTNAHLIMEQYCEPLPENSVPLSQEKAYLIALSAKTDIALQEKIKNLNDWLSTSTSSSLDEISYTLNVGRDHFQMRCIIVAATVKELMETLRKLIEGKPPENCIINMSGKPYREQPVLQKLCESLLKEVLSDQFTNAEHTSKLLALGNFFTEGYTIEWQVLHSTQQKRLSLPPYPFAKNRYWLPEIAENFAVRSDGAPQLGMTTANLSLLKENLTHHISAILKINSATINTAHSLHDMGLDSLALKELILQLEKEYQVEINPALFFTYDSIDTLSEHFLSLRLEKTSTPLIVPLHDISTRITHRETTHLREPIAIVGMQGYFPQSADLQLFWEKLTAGHDFVTEIPLERWNWQNNYGDSKKDAAKTNSKWGAFLSEIDTFDAAFFNISSREANLMDPQHRLFLEVVWKTIEDAGYNPFDFANKDIGVFVGMEFHEYESLIAAAPKRIFHGHVATGNSHAMLANRISYFLNLRGPSEVINTTCSSALVAVHRGVNSLRNRECQAVIVGGINLILNPDTYVITSQLGALSSEGQCKTFDKSADGYVKGEGVAAIMLKTLGDAERDGDPIYGVIKGSAVNHGGKARSLTAPNVSAQTDLLIKAYKDAAIEPSTISYIETHGTGTELGDPAEIEALKDAFSQLIPPDARPANAFCGLGSLKTNIGHLEPASGIAGLFKVLLAMKSKTIPGNLHFHELNPFINLENTPFYLINKTQDWPQLKDKNGSTIPRRAGVSSFGFGGTLAHIVLEENIVASLGRTRATSGDFLITLSAKMPESLQQKKIDLLRWLERNATVDLESLSFTLNAGRAHFEHRFALIVSSLDQLISELKTPSFSHSADQDRTSVLQKIAAKYLQGDAIDWHTLYSKPQRLGALPSYPFVKKRYWFNEELSMAIPAHSPENKIVEGNYTENVINYLQQIFAEKLRLLPEQIAVDETYEVFGIDSLLTLEITTQLEKNFGSLPKTLLYEKNKIALLATYLIKNYLPIVQSLCGQVEVVNISDTPPQIISSSSSIVKNIPDKTHNGDIAIVGLDITFPLAANIQEFWNNLVQGRDCISEIPAERWDYRQHPVDMGDEKKYFNYGGFIPDIDKFDPLFFNISPREAMLMDPQERLFLQSAWAVIEDAGYTRDTLQRTVNNEVGVFAGATYNFYPLLIAEEWAKGNKLPLDIQMFSIANRVSYFLNLNGPSIVVDTACSSSLAALHLACESIQRGECQAAIAGGVNLSLHPAKYHFLGGYGFLAANGRCMSFGEGGEGYVPSEGVGSVLLKPLTLAERDGDRIYGIIKSTTMNHGAKTSGYTVPSPTAQANLIKSALDKAHINPRTISYIEAHGTGTSLGDPIEIRGLQEAFENYTSDRQFCAVGSVKSNIGHLEAAAGISQLTKVLLQLKHKKLVPSLHAEKLNPFIEFEKTPFYVQREVSDWVGNDAYPRRAGLSSFGAGGTNIHVIIEEYIAAEEAPLVAINLPFLLLISAQNKEVLQKYVEQTYLFLKADSAQYSAIKHNQWLHDICHTSQVGREAMAFRLAIVAPSYDALMTTLKMHAENPNADLPGLYQAHCPRPTVTQSNEVADALQNKECSSLARLWISGARINWERLYEDHPIKRVMLTRYPFVKRRCWVTTNTPLILEEPLMTEVVPSVNDQPAPIVSLLDRDETLHYVITLMAKLLELNSDEINIEEPFLTYGMDSISGINFIAQLNQRYSDLLSPMDLYRYPTSSQLIDYIIASATVTVQPEIITTSEIFPDEADFLNQINHLSHAQMNQLLEDELTEIDKLLDAI
ncbi:MAG: AMP-binding protein [Gammaproteobacteria bacterium]|nr:AMP-binding protein [Gammaproteobacteria bacterium]